MPSSCAAPLELLAVGPVADHAERRVDAVVAQAPEGEEHVVGPLDRGHPADPADDEAVVGDADSARLSRRPSVRRDALVELDPEADDDEPLGRRDPERDQVVADLRADGDQRVVPRASQRSSRRKTRVGTGRSSRAARGRGRCARRSAAVTAGEQRGDAADRARLGGVRVQDVRALAAGSAARGARSRARSRTGEISRWSCRSGSTWTPRSSATNAIDSSPRATMPATSVVS